MDEMLPPANHDETDPPEPETVATENAVESDAAVSNVTPLPQADGSQYLRMLEALLFAAAEPLDEQSLAVRLPEGVDVIPLLGQLQRAYENRGVNLVRVGSRWQFRTADDLAFLMQRETVQERRLSKAALETLAIIAYHQPVTRAEIEEIRGVAVSKGTLDVLLETGWVRLRGRRRTPGRPVTFGTSDDFLSHFGLEQIGDLPGLDELKAAGLLDAALPPDFAVPTPGAGESDDEAEDELDLDLMAVEREAAEEDAAADTPEHPA